MYNEIFDNLSEKNLELLKKFGFFYSMLLMCNSVDSFSSLNESNEKISNYMIKNFDKKFLSDIEEFSNLNTKKFALYFSDFFYVLDYNTKSNYFSFTYKNLYLEFHSSLVHISKYEDDITNIKDFMRNKIQYMRPTKPVYDITYLLKDNKIDLINFKYLFQDVSEKIVSNEEMESIILEVHYGSQDKCNHLNDLIFLNKDFELPFKDIFIAIDNIKNKILIDNKLSNKKAP